jgi:hypothetical protein
VIAVTQLPPSYQVAPARHRWIYLVRVHYLLRGRQAFVIAVGQVAAVLIALASLCEAAGRRTDVAADALAEAESASAAATGSSSNFAVWSTRCGAQSRSRTPWSCATPACRPSDPSNSASAIHLGDVVEESIRVHRNRLPDHLDDNPSLRPLLAP